MSYWKRDFDSPCQIFMERASSDCSSNLLLDGSGQLRLTFPLPEVERSSTFSLQRVERRNNSELSGALSGSDDRRSSP